MNQMSSQVEKCEFQNRINNMLWTICRDYRVSMMEQQKADLSDNFALYQAIIVGSRLQYIDLEYIRKYLGWRLKHGFDKKQFQAILDLTLDLFAFNQLALCRPGMAL